MLKIVNLGEYIALLVDTLFLRILIIADLHTGSKYGLLPPDARNKQGTKVPQSSLQHKMWKKLMVYLSEIDDIDVLIIGGDICEGKQVRVAGIGLEDADTDLMVRWATMSLLEICRIVNPKKILIVKGTDYHTSRAIGGDLDFQVAQMLGATYDVYYGIEINAFLGKEKILWNLKHVYPTVSTNTLTPLEKNHRLMCREYNAGRLKYLPNVYGRFHIHRQLGPQRIDSTRDKKRVYGFVGPCLKAQDPYMAQKPYSLIPDIGILYIEQDGTILNTPKGDLLIRL